MNYKNFLNLVRLHTMTSDRCIAHLFETLEKIRIDDIKGDIVECGVWEGGNILGVIEYLHHYSMLDRNVWLYDTFAGMTKPSEYDYKNDLSTSVNDTLSYWEKNKKWCYCELDDVKKRLSKSKFPSENIKYVVGDICETLLKPENQPESISILRLDTDWYDSTKIELEILYPKLNKFGTLIVDDFHYWNGSNKAVMEYFNNDVSDFNTLNVKSAVYKIKI